MLKTFSKIWDFSKKRHTQLVRSLVLCFVRSALAVTQLFAVLYALKALLGELPVKTAIIRVVLLTLICVIGNYITSYFEQINSTYTGFYMVGDQRVFIGNKLRKIPLGFFNDTSSGRIIATLTSTLSGIESGAVTSMAYVISGLFNCFAFFLFMMIYDWRFGLITGLGILTYLLVVGWQMKVSKKNAPSLQEAQSTLAASALSFLQGIKVTKAFQIKKGDKQLKDAIQKSCDENIHLTSSSMPSQYASSLVTAVFESILLFAAMYFYLVQGSIALDRAVILLLFSFMVFGSLNQAGSILSMLGLLNAGIQEVTKVEETEELSVLSPEKSCDSNEIIFKDVSFSYGDHEILHNISTTITPNSLTAIIGPSGSGKTTLCQLIPRFRDVKKGSITIGGIDVKNMDFAELMKKISMVFQKVYLFEDTILNNIRFGKPDASYEEVIAAAKAARCHDFIMALPDGYDTMVEEGGSSLSGGEKQRISIARAILKDSPVIILDEATSALDAENEHEILAAIDELTRNKTVIMIAHRIQSVQKADHIIALKDGKIVQEGTHRQLAGQKGLYSDFIHAKEKAAGWQLGNK